MIALVDYSRLDTRLNTAPPYLCSFAGVDRLENWSALSPGEYRTRCEQWMDALIAAVDRAFPGFASAVVQRAMSTALTMHRELNTPGGAVYGFAAPALRTASRAFSRRARRSMDCGSRRRFWSGVDTAGR